MSPIKASMTHSAKTISLLAVTQYNTFCFHRKILQLILAVGLVCLGLSGLLTSFLSTILILSGCWMGVSLDISAKHSANRIINAMNGVFPKSQHLFYSDHFTLIANSKSSEDIPYSSVIALIEKGPYCYIYINKVSAYMVDKATITGGFDKFAAELSRTTGLKWKKPNNLINFRFDRLSFLFKR